MVIYSMQRDFHAEAWEMFLLIIYLKCMQYFTIKKKKKKSKKRRLHISTSNGEEKYKKENGK